MRAIAKTSIIFVIGAGVLLGGCATKESVENAQATADLAKSDASSAHSAADRAQSSADGAAKMAQDALSSAQSANDRIDKLIAQMEERKHDSKRHHRRHTAAADTAACPPQQKTELRLNHRQALIYTAKHRVVRYITLPEKTARN
jgi:hypothetical protein